VACAVAATGHRAGKITSCTFKNKEEIMPTITISFAGQTHTIHADAHTVNVVLDEERRHIDRVRECAAKRGVYVPRPEILIDIDADDEHVSRLRARADTTADALMPCLQDVVDEVADLIVIDTRFGDEHRARLQARFRTALREAVCDTTIWLLELAPMA
jgi:hypothetical protein